VATDSLTDLERIAHAIEMLCVGWHQEHHGQYVKHEPLLAQLGYTVLLRGTGPVQLGSNPNKSKSKPPHGNVQSIALLDDIREEARDMCADIREELDGAESNRLPVPHRHLYSVLYNLLRYAGEVQHVRPSLVARVADRAARWVSDARLVLGYDSRTVILPGTTCGACGGVLSAPEDGWGSVMCQGVPSSDPEAAQQPCGARYDPEEWPALLAANHGVAYTGLVSTRDAVTLCLAGDTSVDRKRVARWIYNWAREGKITNYGSAKKAVWDTAEVLAQHARFVAPYSRAGEHVPNSG
jgi:hypothetical protein